MVDFLTLRLRPLNVQRQLERCSRMDDLKIGPDLKNSSGFTLLEIIIAAGLSVVIAMGLAMLMTSTTKTETNIRVKQEAFSYQQQMRYERKVSPPPPADP